jgi:hypothetical protein
MPANNLNTVLAYRPLKAGIAVQNPVVRQIGTIGLIATADGNDRWIVSCYHVLCRFNGVFPAGGREPIFQPFETDDTNPVAEIDGSRADRQLDCAAALIGDVPTVSQIFGIGQLSQPSDAVVGMRVIKCGADTGVTEGSVAKISNGSVEILATGSSPDYQLSGPGDSGAAWVDANTGAPVALHTGGSAFEPGKRALAVPMVTVLRALGLNALI